MFDRAGPLFFLSSRSSSLRLSFKNELQRERDEEFSQAKADFERQLQSQRERRKREAEERAKVYPIGLDVQRQVY